MISFRAIFESMFDTEVFKDYQKKYSPSKNKLEDEDRRRIDKLLACPSALPADFDGTLEAWLLRISLWGKIKINRKDPEDHINKEITRDHFLDYIGDDEKNSFRGKWTVEAIDINKIRFYRKFDSINGKEETEELVVFIDLRDDLKKKLKEFLNRRK